MKHAYLILAHSDADHLRILVGALDDTRNDIYIHIDKKSDIDDFTNIKAYKAKLHFTKNRTDIRWGAPSQIDGEYILFKAAYNPNVYSRYHLISGADFPLKSQDYIHDFFSNHPHEEFIHFSGCENNGNGVTARELYKKCRLYHFFLSSIKSNNKYKAILSNTLRRGILAFQMIIKIRRRYSFEILYKGSQWGSFTSNFIKTLLEKEQTIKSEFKFTHCCDEVYKQTIAMQERFSISEYGNMRYIDFSRGSLQSPYVFIENDLEELKSRPELFARKFSTTQSKSLCNKLLS